MTTNQSERFGKYEVIKLLGEGGFARVYLVEDENGEQWALKHIHEDLIKKDPSYQEQFAREADIQKKLRHDHIVGVHDFSAKEGYLVLDYVEGCETLKAIVEREYPDGIDLVTVFKILEPLEAALTYIHNGDNTRPQLAHLDITPKNILIQRRPNRKGETEWNVRLADFGLARMVDLDGHAKGGESRWGVGTFGFMAPEQEKSQDGIPGISSDIYSLGLLIGFMLTGRQTGQEILKNLHDETLYDETLYDETKHTLLPPMFPLEVKRVLQRATNKIPDHRYASVQGLVTAFANAVRVLGPEKTPTVLPLGRKESRLRIARGLKKVVSRYYWIVATIVLFGLIAGVLAWNLPQTHWTRLHGLDLTAYCHSLRYQELIDDSTCASHIDLNAACDWQWSLTDLHIQFDDPNNPNNGTCEDSQGTPIGGISDMDGYCQHLGFYGAPVASPDKTGSGWTCQQKFDVTWACIWEFTRIDVQARRDDAGNWNCYSLF